MFMAVARNFKEEDEAVIEKIDNYADFYLHDIMDGNCCFHNRELVSFIFPYIKERYPDAVIIDLITSQYIIIKKEHLNRLQNMMRKKMADLETQLSVLNEIIYSL